MLDMGMEPIPRPFGNLQNVEINRPHLDIEEILDQLMLLSDAYLSNEAPGSASLVRAVAVNLAL